MRRWRGAIRSATESCAPRPTVRSATGAVSMGVSSLPGKGGGGCLCRTTPPGLTLPFADTPCFGPNPNEERWTTLWRRQGYHQALQPKPRKCYQHGHMHFAIGEKKNRKARKKIVRHFFHQVLDKLCRDMMSILLGLIPKRGVSARSRLNSPQAFPH